MNPKGLKPCLLPWVSFGTNPFGSPRPCGLSALKGKNKVQNSTISNEFNSELFKSIRKDFLKGQWPKNCERCRYSEESKPGHSKKSDSDVDYPVHGHLLESTLPDGSVKHYPKYIDIRLGTVCNLKCIHCGTGNSNKWLEDKELLDKYQNTKTYKHIDNRWIDRDGPIWQDIYTNIQQIEKFFFIGGEPFASVQHNRFIETISQTSHAANITLHYVSNGLLLTEKLWNQILNFKDVVLNVSLDGTGDVLEFFRFPTKSDLLEDKLLMLERTKKGSVDLSIQWTSSNISLYYLAETIDYFEKTFTGINFRMRNFVDYPAHMSAQNLPLKMKQRIESKLKPYLEKYPEIKLYIRQMNDGDLWPTQAETLKSYLNDLSIVRGLDWKVSLVNFYNDLKESEQYCFLN